MHSVEQVRIKMQDETFRTEVEAIANSVELLRR
jgi:hypothetical protein